MIPSRTSWGKAVAVHLLPCPYCGAQPGTRIVELSPNNFGHAGPSLRTNACGGGIVMCGCGASTIVYRDHAEAIAAWNRTAPG